MTGDVWGALADDDGVAGECVDCTDKPAELQESSDIGGGDIRHDCSAEGDGTVEVEQEDGLEGTTGNEAPADSHDAPENGCDEVSEAGAEHLKY